MTTDGVLRDSAQRGARRRGLALLRAVRDARDRLDDTSDDEALHDFRVALRRLRSWLRAFRPLLSDTLRHKVERRLKRIADATGSSRDLEVHIAWVDDARESMRGRARDGPAWLIDRLRARKATSDAALRHVIDDEYDRAVEDAEAGLACYTALVLEPEPPFAPAFAELVGQHATAFVAEVACVTSLGDRAEAHAARIAAKRLRYLLEALEHDRPAAHPIIAQLKALQDNLGELHDAQVFASEIAALQADLIAAQPLAPEQHVAGLHLLSRRLRRQEVRAFRVFGATWAQPKLSAFTAQVSALAESLNGECDA